MPTYGRVAGAEIGQESVIPQEGVRVGNVAAFATIRASNWRQRKPSERKWNG
jgi:hypothetical protein